jgi:hypothetical protein
VAFGFVIITTYSAIQIKNMLTKKFNSKGLIACYVIAIFMFGSIAVRLVKMHPFQNIYFNCLVPKNGPFEYDYWATSYANGLRYVLRNNPDKTIKIYFYGSHFAQYILTKSERNRIVMVENFEKDGLKTVYPGLKSHPSHEVFAKMMNIEYGFGGMMTLDVGSLEKANELMELMQQRNLGYLAVSLGFYKTLFSAPGTSTSSEIPLDEQKEMGLTDGLIRFSIGLDNDIERTYLSMKACMQELSIL